MKKLAVIFFVIAGLSFFDVVKQHINGVAEATHRFQSREESKADNPQGYREVMTHDYLKVLAFVVAGIVCLLIEKSRREADLAGQEIVDGWASRDKEETKPTVE